MSTTHVRVYQDVSNIRWRNKCSDDDGSSGWRGLPILGLLLITKHPSASRGNPAYESEDRNREDYVRDACSVTRYKEICTHSLEPFSGTAKRSTRKWAEAAVSVTMSEAKNLSHYLSKLKKNRSMRRKSQRLALSDCIECFSDTIDNIQDSLNELRRLDSKMFDSQMGNVETWMSAALTYEDTCIDGFEGKKGKQVRLLHNKILKLTYITSNALALVSKLASAGDQTSF